MNSENVDRSQQNRKRTAPQPLPASRQIQQTSSTVAAHPQHVSHLSPQVSNQVRSSTGPSTPNHASGSRSAVQATAAVQSQAKSKPSQTAHNQIEPSSTQDPSSIRRTTETSNTTLQSREIQHPHQVSPANVLKKKPPPPFSFTGSPSKPEQKPSEGWYKFRHPESHYPDPVKSWYITRPGNFELKLVPPPSHSTPPQHRPSRRRIEGAVRPVQKPSIAGLLPTMGSSSSHTRWIPGEPGATDLRRSHPLRETTDSRVASSATPSHVQGGKATTGPVPKFRESPKPIPSQSRAKGAASPSQKPSNGGSSSGVVSSSSLTRRMPGEFGATDLRRPHPLKETVDSRAVSSSAEPKHVQGAKATVAIEPVSSLREIPKPIVSSESHTSTKGAGNPPQKSSDGGSSSGVVSSLGPTRRMPGELGATELRRSHPLKETVDPRAVSSSVEPKYSQGDKTTSLIEPVPKSPTPSHPKGPASPSRKSSDGGSSSSVVSSSSLIRRMLGELGATDLRHSLTETIGSGVVSSSAESNHGQGEEATGAIEPVPTSPKPSYIEGPASPSHKSFDGGSSSSVVSSSSLTRRMLGELGPTDLRHSLTETIDSRVVSLSAEPNHGQGGEATGAIRRVLELRESPKPVPVPDPISYPQRPSSEVAEHIGHRTLSLGASTASSGTSRQRQNMQSTASRASAPSVTSAGRARSYQPPVSSTATSKYEKKHESASTTDSAPEITALLDSVSSCEEDEASSVHWDPKGKSKYSSTHWTETSSSSDKETSPVTSSEWPPFDAAFFDHLENSLPSILEPFNKIRALPYVRGSLDDVQSLATIFDTRLSSIMHSLERIPLNIQITTPYQHASEALLFNRRLLVDTIECLEGNYMPGGRVAAEEIEEAFDLVKDLLRSVVDSIKQLLLVSEGLFTENTLLTNSPDPDAASLQGSTEADTLNQGDMSILERAFRYSDRTSDQQNASDDTGSFYSTAYVEGTCQEMASNAGERPWSMAFSNNPSLRDTIYESEAGVNECRSVSLCSIDSIDTSRFSFPEILEYEQAGELQISKQKALEDAFDVKIDGGLLTTASFPALVRFMTSLHEVTTDYEISQLFFLAFRTFATPVELFEELVKRWRSEPPSTVPPAQRHIWKTHSKAVKRQVAKILNLWVQLHWRQETDKDVAKLIVEFAGKLATHSFTSGYISNLQKCAESQHQGGIRREWIARAKKAPSGFTDLSDLRTYSGSVTLLAIRDSDLASQLTILESSLFRSVDPEDYWRQCTGQCVDNQVESKISKVIARNNALSAWASSTVAEEFNSTSTAEVYCKFANVATKCVQLRNYSSAFAIWLSLVSVAVERLIPAQKHSTNTRRQIANLDALFADHSMRIYWKALNESSELAVPILAQFRGRLIRTSVPPDVSLPSGKKGINVLRLRAVCVHLRGE